MTTAVQSDVVRVGDRMRFTVALLEAIASGQESQFSIVMVKVVDVKVEADGTKTVVLERCT